MIFLPTLTHEPIFRSFTALLLTQFADKPKVELGIESPSLMRNLWEGWKRVAKRMGDIQARLLLSFFYFVVLGPFALLVRWASDPLAIKVGTPRGWQLRGDEEKDPVQRAVRQF